MKKRMGKLIAGITAAVGVSLLTAGCGKTPTTTEPKIPKEQFNNALVGLTDNITKKYNTQYNANVKTNDVSIIDTTSSSVDGIRVANYYFTIDDKTEDKKYYVDYQIDNYTGGKTHYENIIYSNENFDNLNVELNRTYLPKKAWSIFEKYTEEQNKYIFTIPYKTDIIKNGNFDETAVMTNGKINSINSLVDNNGYVSFTIISSMSCSTDKGTIEYIAYINYYVNCTGWDEDIELNDKFIDLSRQISIITNNWSTIYFIETESTFSLKYEYNNAQPAEYNGAPEKVEAESPTK